MQVFRFGIVGGLATAVHMGVAWSLYHMAPDLHVLLVNCLAFSAAFVVSFFGHSRFTFRAEGSAGKFLLAALAGFFANNVILGSLVWLGIPGLISICAATLVAPAVVFIVSKFWVFAPND